MINELTKETFDEFISTGVVLVDFWAAWCGPCRMQFSIIDQVAKTFPNLKVGKVDVDSEPSLPTRYGISSIPFLFLFKNGVPVRTFIGLQTEFVLNEAIKKALE